MTPADWDAQFAELFSAQDDVGRAPSSLKARLYSAFVREQQKSGPLASLSDTVASGEEVCVFEKLVQIAPFGEQAKQPFFCGACHARLLGEHFENPPIFWPHCPYVKFKES